MKLRSVLFALLGAAVLALGGLYLHTLNELVTVRQQAASLAGEVEELSLLADQVTQQAQANSQIYAQVIGLLPEEDTEAAEKQSAEDPGFVGPQRQELSPMATEN